MKPVSLILDKLQNRRLFVFCGAGISLPSGIPTVGSVDDRGVLHDGIQTCLMRKLGFRTTEIKRYLGLIPFEAFLQALFDNHMPLATFSRLFHTEATYAHHFLAELLRRGMLSTIGTTNFDTCIETAVDMAASAYTLIYRPEDLNRIGSLKNRTKIIFKLHGSVHQIENMGLTIRSIAQKGNLGSRRKIADSFFMGRKREDTLLVLGYSCSDVLDLVKWVPDLAKKLSVIYIEHCSGKRVACAASDEYNAKVVRMFKGHDLNVFKCDTELLLRALADHLGFVCEPGAPPRSAWREILSECMREFTGFTLAKTRGNLYYLFQRYEESLRSHLDALSIAKSDLQKLIALRNIAFSHFRMNRLSESLFVSRQAYRLARRLGEHTHETNILMIIAACYMDMGQYKRSLTPFMDALALSKRYGLRREKCFILSNIGLLHAYKGRMTESLKYTRQAINVARRLGEVETEGKCYANIGEAYLNVGEYSKAIKATQLAIDIAIDIGDWHGEINRKTNLLIAEFKSNIKDVDICQREATELLQRSMGIGNELYTANCHQLIGDCHIATGDVESAIVAWSKAKRTYDKIAPAKGRDISRKIRNSAFARARG